MSATRPAELPSANTTATWSTRSTKTALLKVLLADDHQLILDAVRHTLEDSGEFKIVAETKSAAEVLPLVTRTRPDIVLLDILMAGMDGLDCLDDIKKQHPETTVVVLSALADQPLIDDALRRGASAYVVKSVKPVDLAAVIRQAVGDPAAAAIGLPDDSTAAAAKTAGLTRRETTILTALTQGVPNAAIADQLAVSAQTVRFHLKNIYRKLGVANRTEATLHAYQQGLAESPFHHGETDTTR